MSSVGGTSGPLSASAIVVGRVGGSGSHILRVEGYSVSKGLGKDGYVASETFAAGGHRWRLLYYPNSVDDSDSVAIVLNCLDRDAVEAKFMIGLLDQEGNLVPAYSRAYLYTFSFFSPDDDKAGRDLIKRSDLETSPYLKDDAFWVRCDVTVRSKIDTKPIPVSQVPAGAAAGGVAKKKRERSSSEERERSSSDSA